MKARKIHCPHCGNIQCDDALDEKIELSELLNFSPSTETLECEVCGEKFVANVHADIEISTREVQ